MKRPPITPDELTLLERLLATARALHTGLQQLESAAYALTKEPDRRGHTFEAMYGEGNFDALVLLERLGLELEGEDADDA
jgi:hypothetical protein